MTLLDDFKRFVNDAEARGADGKTDSRSQYAIWAAANPAELSRWQTFRDAIVAGQRPSPPTMTTAHGRELIDAGIEYLDATAVAPPPPPPPPSGKDGASLPRRIIVADDEFAHTYYVDGTTGDDGRAATAAANQATPWRSLQHALEAVPIPGGGGSPQRIILSGAGCTITDLGPGSDCPAAWKQTNSTGTWQPSRRLTFPDGSPLVIEVAPGERALLPVRFFFGHGDSNITFKAIPVGGKRALVCDPRFPLGQTVGGMTWIGTRNFQAFGLQIRNAGWAGGSGGGLYVGAHSQYGPSINPIMWGCQVNHCGGAIKGFHGVYWGGTTGGQEIGIQGGGIVNSRLLWNSDDNLCPHNCAVGSVFANLLCLGYGGGGLDGGGVSSVPLTDSGASYGWSDGVTYFAAPSGQQSSDNVLVNSILAFNKSYGLQQYDSASGGGHVEKNNLYFGNGAGTRRDASGKWKMLSTLLSEDPLFSRYVKGDPSSDLHLRAGSPAAGAADPAYLPSDDFDFAARSHADIGPYAVAV